MTLAEEVMAKNATVSPDREQVATFTIMTTKKIKVTMAMTMMVMD